MAQLPSIVTADVVEAQRFMDAAVAAGHEGVVVKDLAARYEAGRRGSSWRKVKPVHTLDLVVLAVEWGHGRRQGWLSNLHLGARGCRALEILAFLERTQAEMIYLVGDIFDLWHGATISIGTSGMIRSWIFSCVVRPKV